MPNRTIHILITGASRGLGAALAIEFAKKYRQNAKLILTATSAHHLETTQLSCQAYQATVDCVSTPANTVIDEIPNILSKHLANTVIDIAILNAGITQEIDQQWEPWSTQTSILQTNLLQPMAITQLILPAMQKRNAGQIVFISSIAAFRGFARTPSYCTSKAALKVYSESLRHWLSDTGIHIQTVFPGYIATDMTNNLQRQKPLLISPEKAAKKVFRGIENKTNIISFPKLLVLSQRLLDLLPSSLSDKILTIAGLK